MDKSENHYVYVPPRISSSAHYSRESAADHARAADSSQVRSFDDALDRVRDRTVARQQGEEKQTSMDSAKENNGIEGDTSDVQNTPDITNAVDMPDTTPLAENAGLADISDSVDSSAVEDLTALQEQDYVDAEQVPVPVIAADNLLLAISTDASQRYVSDANVASTVSVDMGQAAPSGATHGEVPAATSAAGSDTVFRGAVNAENIATMMLRMERTAGVHEGQWSFTVLDNPMGVAALHMQRSAQGSWQVDISMNQANQIDGAAHAEELKEALMTQGHKVDTVTITGSETS